VPMGTCARNQVYTSCADIHMMWRDEKSVLMAPLLAVHGSTPERETSCGTYAHLDNFILSYSSLCHM
jgi:hypothetical protein